MKTVAMIAVGFAATLFSTSAIAQTESVHGSGVFSGYPICLPEQLDGKMEELCHPLLILDSKPLSSITVGCLRLILASGTSADVVLEACGE